MAARNRHVAHHLLFALLGACVIALAVRLFLFQSLSHAQMSERAERQQRMGIPLPARRGNIYASSYAAPVLLASSQQVPSCFVDPGLLRDDELEGVATAIAQAVGKAPEDMYGLLLERRASRFVWLARELDDVAAQRVRELKLPGVGLLKEWRREYPGGSLAAHVIGFAGSDGSGLEGIERFADNYLRATDGMRTLRVDAARRPVESEPEKYEPPRDGFDVQLTIDVVIQEQLEKVLIELAAKHRAESVVGVVLDPRTGDVLALANVPTYDLRSFGQFDRDAYRNRALTDFYEPGSVFKPFIASATLERGLTRLGERFFCHGGAYRCKSGRLLHDAHGYGFLTFEEILIKSSNIGMAQLGERLGNEAQREAVTGFGFGSDTGIDLPGESPGQVNRLSNWTTYSTTSVPMGQEVCVTALQLASAFSALANEGVLLRPRLIRAVTGLDGQRVLDKTQPQEVRRVVAAKTARTMVREVLAQVPVIGTAKTGKLDGWTSFGKTGTAQIARPQSAGGGYEPHAYVGSYVAGAPVKNPRLVCLISVRKPDVSTGYYGGSVAGPAVKKVLEKALAYLEVPKDGTSGAAAGPADASE